MPSRVEPNYELKQWRAGATLPAYRNCSGSSSKCPCARRVRVRLLLWVRCFDLPFRGPAVVHKGPRLEQEKQNGSPLAPSRLPPFRRTLVFSCGLAPVRALFGLLLGPSPLSSVGRLTVVDYDYCLTDCRTTTWLHGTMHTCHAARLRTLVFSCVRTHRQSETGTGTSTSTGTSASAASVTQFACLALPRLAL